MKPVKTWILIANAKTARIVENDGPGKGLFQPPGLTRQAAEEAAYADQPGRSFSSSGNVRSKMEPHQKILIPRDGFAGELVNDLVSNHQKGQFDRLIVCAAPAMLAHVRDLMPDAIQSQIIAEVPKDLTQVATDKLAPHFGKVSGDLIHVKRDLVQFCNIPSLSGSAPNLDRKKNS